MAYGMNRPRDAFFHKQNQLTEAEEKRLFDNAMRALEAEIMSIGMHLAIDADARFLYRREIAVMSSELQAKVRRGEFSWRTASEKAVRTRNEIMDILRDRSTPVGRAVAEHLKLNGKDFDSMINAKTIEVFGDGSDFHKLNPEQRNRVYAAIVESAGRSNRNISVAMRVAGPAGRGLMIISLAISTYTIANAENKMQAAGREAAITGVGVAGAVSGGALAGLACGPAAPICVSIGAFVGGALAAFGTTVLW